MSDLRAEQETIIRWDRTSPTAIFYTASPGQAQKWRRKGWPVQHLDRGWGFEAPIKAVGLRARASVERVRNPLAARRPGGRRATVGAAASPEKAS